MGLTAGRNSHKTAKKMSPLAVKIDQFDQIVSWKKKLTVKIFLLKAMEKLNGQKRWGKWFS